MKVCSTAQMREIDRAAAELGGIPGIVLMENAAISCIKHMGDDLSEKKVAVFCGKGNNGGDGFAIARHLLNMGVETAVFLVCGSEFSGDALTNYEILSKMGADISEIFDDDCLKYKIMSCDIAVDAIFGTGVRGEVTGVAAEVIDSLNKYAKFVISVDIPSGVNGDDGSIAGVAVKADRTVTFGAYKLGMLCFPGADYIGEVFAEKISIPDYIMNDIDINVTDEAFARSVMPKRHSDTHKGDYGKLFIAGGAKGLTGAPSMAAEAALRCGCGLVSVGVPASLNGVLEVKLTEAMTLPLPDSGGNLTEEATEAIVQKALQSDALVFGPGIGRTDAIVKILRAVLKKSQVPVLIDADGLFALAKDMDMLSECGCNLVLTPHEAEFARLSGYTIKEIKKDRCGLSRRFATEFGVTLVLKGAKTIVTAPDGTQYINITGNSGMATGGSGDVLSGIIGAFLARGCKECDAAALGVYCHARAGDKAAETVGEDSLIPSDIISAIHLILPVE